MAIFTDEDPVERDLNQRVEDMNADALMQYFKASQKAVNGLEVAIRPYVDFKTFEMLIKDYPQPRAGRIVKWLFFKHKGKAIWDRRKQVVRISQLAPSWRWMVEQWSAQYQLDMKREERRVSAPSTGGFASIMDL